MSLLKKMYRSIASTRSSLTKRVLHSSAPCVSDVDHGVSPLRWQLVKKSMPSLIVDEQVVEELVSNGVLDYNDAMERVETLRRSIEDSQKVGDTSRLFLMELFKAGKLQITDIQYYADKLKLLDTKPEQREGGKARNSASETEVPTTEHIQNFKVYESGKNDARSRIILQFDFGRCQIRLIIRGKPPRMFQFDEITNFDVVNNTILIMTEKDTLQLVNDSDSESEKIHQLLRSIGHDDGIEQILDDTLIQGQLDKKGPGIKGLRSVKRWVAVTHGKLSYYKMDGPDNNVRTECPQNSLELKEGKNSIKKFGSDGFTIIEDDKEFSFTIPGKKLKQHQIIDERDKWVHFIEQAYIGCATLSQQGTPTSSPMARSDTRRSATVLPSNPVEGNKRTDSSTKDGQILINMVRQELEKISQKMDYAVGEDEAAPQVRRINEILSSIEGKLSSGAAYVPSPQPSLPPASYKPSPKAEMITSCCQTDQPYSAPAQYAPGLPPGHPLGQPSGPPQFNPGLNAGTNPYPTGHPQYAVVEQQYSTADYQTSSTGSSQYHSGGSYDGQIGLSQQQSIGQYSPVGHPVGSTPPPLQPRTGSLRKSPHKVTSPDSNGSSPECPADSASSLSSLQSSESLKSSEGVEYETVEVQITSNIVKEPVRQPPQPTKELLSIEDEPIYDTPASFRKKHDSDGIFEEEEDMYDVPAFGRNKIKEEELQNILSGHGAVEVDGKEEEEDIYDTPTCLKSSTEVDGLIDSFSSRFLSNHPQSRHRARSQANSMACRPLIKSWKQSSSSVSSEVIQLQDKGEKFSPVFEFTETTVFDEEEDIYDVPDCSKVVKKEDSDPLGQYSCRVKPFLPPGTPPSITPPPSPKSQRLPQSPSVPTSPRPDSPTYEALDIPGPPTRPVPQLPPPSRAVPKSPLSPPTHYVPPPSRDCPLSPPTRPVPVPPVLHKPDLPARTDIDKPAPPPRRDSKLSVRGSRGEPPQPPQRKDSKLSILGNEESLPAAIIEELPPPPPDDDLYDALPARLPSPLPPSPTPTPKSDNNISTTPVKPTPPAANPRQISVPATPDKEGDHLYNSVDPHTEAGREAKPIAMPVKAPSAPISPPAPGVPGAPSAPGAPRPPGGPPRPPTGSMNKGSLEPSVLPKVKLVPLHWYKIPPLALKNSVWREMGDKSSDIDVQMLEALFGTKAVAHELQPKKKQNEQKTMLDAKRAQNLGIFLRGAAMDSNNLETFVSCVPSRTSSVSMDKVVTLKKYLPTKEDRESYGRLKSENIMKLDKVDQFMYHMVNVPHLAERLDILDVCCNLPQDYDDLKIMVQYVCEACKGLYESVHFKNSLEIVLTVGNMMNASIKKTAAGFKLSSTLSKLPTIKSADKTTSLLDFLVDQMIENDGECLNFLEELEVCHRATELTSGSIVALTAEVDIMKQELRKLQQYKKQLSGGKDKSKELVKFVTEVDTFISMYQPSVEALNSQCMSMSMSYQKVLERFGESPKTDSEDFFKTISEYLNAIKASLKKSHKPLPPCVAHLARPSPHSTGGNTPTVPNFKQKQVNIGDALSKSHLFKKSATAPELAKKRSSYEEHSVLVKEKSSGLMSKLFGKSPKSSTASNVSETSSETGQSALNKKKSVSRSLENIQVHDELAALLASRKIKIDQADSDEVFSIPSNPSTPTSFNKSSRASTHFTLESDVVKETPFTRPSLSSASRSPLASMRLADNVKDLDLASKVNNWDKLHDPADYIEYDVNGSSPQFKDEMGDVDTCQNNEGDEGNDKKRNNSIIVKDVQEEDHYATPVFSTKTKETILSEAPLYEALDDLDLALSFNDTTYEDLTTVTVDSAYEDMSFVPSSADLQPSSADVQCGYSCSEMLSDGDESDEMYECIYDLHGQDTVRELHTFTMEKQSGGKKLSKHWDTRHFKLYTSGILEYYKKVADKKPCGQLDLSLCTKFENDDNDKLLTKITDPASARIWTLRSNNASDANKFRNCCRDLIGSALEKDICDLSG